jgi:transcriptional regulator with XRE-family HTH domain
MAPVPEAALDRIPATGSDNIEIDLGEPPVVPVRSVLYHLAPIARGTALRESLSSFALRLADQHTMTPSALTLVPGIDRRCRSQAVHSAWARPSFNATGWLAMLWSSELARLTGHSRLDDLTLLSLARVVSIYGLVSETRKWCPHCLHECERGGVPYGQLLWDIAAVDACPVHAVRLVSTCRCGGTGLRVPSAAKQLPHICQYCHRMLTHRATRAPLVLLQRARTVADLLEAPDFNCGLWPADGFSRFLISAASLHFEGKLVSLTNALGLSRTTVSGWVHGGRRPTLERIVTLAEVFGCPIRRVLQGDASDTSLRAAVSLGSRRQTSSNIPPELRERIPRQLQALQRRRKAISLGQAVRELQVSHHFLRRNYRTTCDAIVAKFKRQRAAKAAKRRKRLMLMFQIRAKAIAASGTQPSLKRAMGQDSFRLVGLRRQCLQIIADVVRERWGRPP